MRRERERERGRRRRKEEKGREKETENKEKKMTRQHYLTKWREMNQRTSASLEQTRHHKEFHLNHNNNNSNSHSLNCQPHWHTRLKCTPSGTSCARRSFQILSSAYCLTACARRSLLLLCLLLSSTTTSFSQPRLFLRRLLCFWAAFRFQSMSAIILHWNA